MKSDTTQHVMAGYLHICYGGKMFRLKKGPKEHQDTITMPRHMQEALDRNEVFVEFTIRQSKLDKGNG